MKRLFAFALLGAMVLGCDNSQPQTQPANPKLEIQVTPPPPAPTQPAPPAPPPHIYSKQFMIGYWDGYHGRGESRLNYDYRNGYELGHYDRINGIQRFKP
jgi:hypothetical protein